MLPVSRLVTRSSNIFPVAMTVPLGATHSNSVDSNCFVS